jgi:hypothetical protein
VSPKRYTEEEVTALLQRAAELQVQSPGSRAMTLEEVEKVAAEVGLDAALIRRAANELRHGEGQKASPGWVRKLLGGPAKLRWEVEVDGEIDESAHEAILEAIHVSITEPGTTSTAGRTLTWSFVTQGKTISVSVSPRNGKTVIRVEEGLANLIGGLYGGIVGGVGGGLGPFAGIAGAALLGPVGAVAGVLLTLGASYVGTRAIYDKVTDKKEQKLAGLVDEVREAVERSIEARGGLSAARGRQGLADAPFDESQLDAVQSVVEVKQEIDE